MESALATGSASAPGWESVSAKESAKGSASASGMALARRGSRRWRWSRRGSRCRRRSRRRSRRRRRGWRWLRRGSRRRLRSGSRCRRRSRRRSRRWRWSRSRVDHDHPLDHVGVVRPVRCAGRLVACRGRATGEGADRIQAENLGDIRDRALTGDVRRALEGGAAVARIGIVHAAGREVPADVGSGFRIAVCVPDDRRQGRSLADDDLKSLGLDVDGRPGGGSHRRRGSKSDGRGEREGDGRDEQALDDASGRHQWCERIGLVIAQVVRVGTCQLAPLAKHSRGQCVVAEGSRPAAPSARGGIVTWSTSRIRATASPATTKSGECG